MYCFAGCGSVCMFGCLTYQVWGCGLISYSMQEQNPQNPRRETNKETSDGLSQVPKKRRVNLSAHPHVVSKAICFHYSYLACIKLKIYFISICRSPFSRSPRKSREGGSPLILVRGSKKAGPNLPKITLKDTARRNKA